MAGEAIDAVLIQNCTKIESIEKGVIKPSNPSQVNASDDVYAANGTINFDGGTANITTWHNETTLPTGASIDSVLVYIEWRLQGNTPNEVKIKVYEYGVGWHTLYEGKCEYTEALYSYNASRWIDTKTEAKNVRVKMDFADGGSRGALKPLVDWIYVEVTYRVVPPPSPPVANFTYSPTYPLVNETVIFNATASSDSDGYIANYTWNFGDGTNGTGMITNHTFTSAGIYNVTLTVTDNDALTDSTAVSVTVNANKLIWFSFKDADGNPIAGVAVTIYSDNSTTNPNQTYTPIPDQYVKDKVAKVWQNPFYSNSSGMAGADIHNEPSGVKYSKSYVYLTFNITDGPTVNWPFSLTGEGVSDGVNVTDPFGKIKAGAIVTSTTSPTGFALKLDKQTLTKSEPAVVQLAPPKYYLTVISPYGTPGGEGWYYNCTTAYATLDIGIVDHLNGTRRVFTHWSGDASGTNYSKSNPIHMDSNKTAIANWKTQYNVTFAQTGLDATATGTVVTVNTTSITFPELPFSMWVNSSDSLIYSYNDIVSSNKTGKRFKLVGVTGPTSPITVTGPVTVTGNYKTQYLLTVHTSGLGTNVTNVYNGTTVLGTATDAAPYTGWFDKDALIQLNIDSPITVGLTRFVFTQWFGDATGTSRPVSVTMNSAKDITASYKTQYEVTFSQFGVGTDFTGTIVTIDGTGYNVTELPVSFWWDKDSKHSFSFALPLVVDAGKQYVWNFTSGLSGLQSGTLTITSSGSVTGNYKTQYQITFDQTGVDTDFTNTVVIIDGTNYNVNALPVSFWWDDSSVHDFSFQSPLVVTINAKQYVWNFTSGLSTLESGSITVTESGTVIGNYKTQYYLTVTSAYDSPTPTSGWFDAGTEITASVTSPWLGPTGVRYVCTEWTGTGSVPASGTTTSVTFTINEPSSITWAWKTQYYLTVKTDPAGIVTIPGEGWYDDSTDVTLTAPTVVNYNFINWDVDGVSQGPGVNPITVHMDGPHTATAHYQAVAPPPPPPPVGGYAAPIDKSHLLAPTMGLAPWIGLAFTLLAAMAITVILIRRRNKTFWWEP